MLQKLRRVGMPRNNVEVDVKVKDIEDDATQAKPAEDIGTSVPYASRLIRDNDNNCRQDLHEVDGSTRARCRTDI